VASIDRLRPLWQPAMHLMYYYCVFSLFYWRINVELSCYRAAAVRVNECSAFEVTIVWCYRNSIIVAVIIIV